MSHYENQREKEEAEMTIKSTFKIKPNPESLLVWDEHTQVSLAAKGETKPRSEYWLRRLADGDVIEINSKTKDKE